MARILRFACIGLMLSAIAAVAQDKTPEPWQGKSKMGGKVLDQAGKPVEGAKVKLVFLQTKTGPDALSGKKGEWKIENIADGMYYVDYSKDGFDPRRIQIEVGGKTKAPNIDLKLTPEGTDPSFAVQMGMEKGQALYSATKYAEARAVFEGLVAKYPKIHQLRLLIARSFHSEKNYAKAGEQLQEYLVANPTDSQVKMLLGNELIEQGKTAEAWQIYSAIDGTQIKEAIDLQTPGFSLLRQKKPVEALKYFELSVKLFPNEPTTYYYRGFANWHAMGMIPKVDDPERVALKEKAKADLNKFLEMAPTAQEAGTAKQILSELAK